MLVVGAIGEPSGTRGEARAAVSGPNGEHIDSWHDARDLAARATVGEGLVPETLDDLLTGHRDAVGIKSLQESGGASTSWHV